MIKLVRFLILIIITGIMLVSCEFASEVSPGTNIMFYQNFEYIDYELAELEFDELPYTIWRLADPPNNPNPVDEDTIEVFHINGGTYYHPLHLCQRMEWYLDSYFRTNDPLYLRWTLKYHEKLMSLSVETEEFLYFPYQFDWPVHGDKNELMYAPWLSGMTQGVALMVFSRLFRFTGDSTYFYQGQKVFNSFGMIKDIHDPWITQVDENNNLWFEEYPQETGPDYTLNGFIFCIYGMFEYWSVTQDPDAELLVKASITTVKKNFANYRIARGVSYYCTKHKKRYPNYHNIHINQFHTLSVFTGDPVFQQMSDILLSDYN